MTCNGLQNQALTPTLSPSFRSLQPHRPPWKLAKLLSTSGPLYLQVFLSGILLTFCVISCFSWFRSQLNCTTESCYLPHTHTHTHTHIYIQRVGLAVGRDTLVISYCLSSSKKAYTGSVMYPTVSVLSMCSKTYWLSACIMISSQALLYQLGAAVAVRKTPQNNSSLTK